jgi:signal transduction histidine kinase
MQRRWTTPRVAFQALTAGIAERASPAPLGVVTIALIALVVVPLAAERYTRPLFEELRTVAAPAQRLLTDVHISLALQGSALRDFVETRNPLFATRFREEVVREIAARERLAEVALLLDTLVAGRYAALKEADDRWHAAAEHILRDPDAVKRGSASASERLYEEVLAAAAHLDQALDAAVHTRRTQIRDAVLFQRRMSAALSGLGLVALVAVILVRRRLRASVAAAEKGRRAVERLLDSKARLMRGITHDIKNPLSAIEGFAAILADGLRGELSMQQRQDVDRIRSNAAAVRALVEDLLELSRADAGQLRVTCQPTELRDVILQAVEEHQPQAQSRSHVLEVRVADEIPMVNTDAARVRQVLDNLLSNAIKYTPDGGRVSVEVELVQGDEPARPRSMVAVHVSDTGPGIPLSQQEAVFDEFTRLDRTGQGGAGLGLAIGRRVSELLGGTLTLESEVGRGSRFTLWLPVGSGLQVASAQR